VVSAQEEPCSYHLVSHLVFNSPPSLPVLGGLGLELCSVALHQLLRIDGKVTFG